MKNRPMHTLVRLMFTNPASAVYLGLVGAAVGVAASEPLWSQNGGDSLIWVWPAFFTCPVLFFVLPIGDAVWGMEMPTWFFVGGIIVSALVQSLALGAVLEGLRGRRQRSIHPYGG
ncbi:SCO4225 family membrane protein [Streptomyces sp. NPDC002577]